MTLRINKRKSNDTTKKMIVEIWRIFADLKFINSNTKKQHYGFK